MGVIGPSASSIRSASRSVRGFSRRRSATDPGIFSRTFDGLVDRAIAGAPADVAGQSDLHGIAGRFRPQREGGENHSGRADAALRAAELDEGLLQRMRAAEPLNRRHPRRGHLRDGHEARIDRLAVDEHGARAAFAFAAAFFRSRQPEVLAKDIEQPRHRVGVDTDAAPVQRELHAISFSGVAGISRRSYPAWRSALITAGAGASIGISPTPFAPKGPCLYGRSISTTSRSGVSSVVGTM